MAIDSPRPCSAHTGARDGFVIGFGEWEWTANASEEEEVTYESRASPVFKTL